jgi:hypothetical protein
MGDKIVSRETWNGVLYYLLFWGEYFRVGFYDFETKKLRCIKLDHPDLQYWYPREIFYFKIFKMGGIDKLVRAKHYEV